MCLKVKRYIIGAVVTTTFACSGLYAQTFSSGSDGSDGDLIVNTPGVTIFTQMPVRGGTVFNFGTITIAAGSTLRLSAQQYPTPLYFLAQNVVTISGTLDLSGSAASGISNPSDRSPTIAGAGGYSGGVGGSSPAAGNGPGGGSAGISACGDPSIAGGGTFTGDVYLLPLIGGSGGGGTLYANGGAGGGAILIASSASIVVAGTINANGGAYRPINGWSGAGSGGAIRLVANTISGSGTVEALAGNSQGPCGAIPLPKDGLVRLEAFQNFSRFQGGPIVSASPFGLFLPSGQPATVQVTSIGGVPVNTSPTGSFTVPDVTVNSTAPLPVQIKAQNIPLGTTVTLTIISENGPDQTIVSSGLGGTVASSSASATVTLPPGFSRGYVKATWTQ